MARIRKVAVLGAGVMGSGIAAHVAGAGIPVLLLDIVPPNLTPEEKKDRAARNRFSQGGKDKALAAKPASFFTPKDAVLVEVGNLEDDLEKLKDCDFIVEAVKEELKVKQDLFAKVEKHMHPGAIVASNTSGLPLARLTEGRGATFTKNFLITHFFNPVRYMKLLEVVVGPKTDPKVVETIHKFGDEVLGKGIVYAKDTPNFIANRIGVFSMVDAVHQMIAMDLTIEQVDAILGKPLGRPKSAAFRTGDMVGLDTLLHVAGNCHELLPNDEMRETFKAPEFVKKMVEKNLLGDKTGGGFYKKLKGDGGKQVLTLDWHTMEYRPQEKAVFECIGEAKGAETVGERIKTMVNGTDKGAQFAWKTLSRTLNYAANRLGEIADDVVNIDRGMKWGFNWELGPFEVLDALGVKATVERMKKDGLKVAPVLEEMAASDAKFYPTPKTYRDFKAKNEAKPIPVSPRALFLPKDDEKKKIEENASATIWDLGDNVLGLEFHSKMNSVDPLNVELMHKAIDLAEQGWAGLVIGNEDPQAFSAGANLFLVLSEAQAGHWKEIEAISAEFQKANMRMGHADVPVVAAPFGLVLGGGAEMAMGAAAMRAYAELYMGLVEVGVGLIPAGGGCKELVFRAMAGVPENVEPFTAIQNAFLNAAMAKVSMSAENAREMGFLAPADQVTLSREQLLRDAKETVLGMARAGWRRPRPRLVKVAGEPGIANLKVALWGMMKGNQISEHDLKIAMHLAKIFCGGSVAAGTKVGEQQFLDLEREAFLSLCGEEKTQARMEHMLTRNKPLRN